jgi:hypothetical protein
MRRLRLLLYAGAMATTLAGSAFAWEMPPSDGSTPTGPLQDAAGVGMNTNASGFQEVGSAYTAGQGQQFTPTASGIGTTPFSTPAPGTAIMRINLQAVAGLQAAWWTGMNGQGYGSASSLPGGGGEAGNKQQPYGVIGFWRFDLAVDGMTKTGMRYGAFTEIRQNSTGGQTTGATTTSANASATSSGTSADNSMDTLYLRNMCLYVGADAYGIFKIGQGSCVDAASAMLTGLNDEFDAGGWDSGLNIAPSQISPSWPWPDGGSDYMPQGLIYLSPVVYGFDTAIGFNPNNSSIITNTSCSDFEGCSNQSTSNNPGDYARWINRFEIGLRYRNAIGPVGLAVSGTWTHSGQVQPGPSAGGSSGTSGPATTGSATVRYNPLNYATIGAEVSINRWFAVGANTMFGAFNGPGVLQAQPIAAQSSATTAVAWEAGAKYTIPTIPVTVGGSYYNFKYQGQPGLPTQRVSQGIDLGVDYGIGPGMVAFGEYMWGQIHQGDYNLLTGACGVGAVCSSTANPGQNNQVQIQIAMFGLALSF